ncbi:phosphoribosyl-AMP cyclohydrolase [Aurantimicrobium minutum]|uniref:phosphoribosyl-AMP cyclohydrolase n=1 Tax=Aurantimicrobium minutum TaxID=708131 RepID=UPI002476F516|nr:phosphoribosyl-AMP cyclohydrolase [Aurantimicrobium minutum]MDH6207767.1 phosphoribosyl-AMP cyclohydrolase [Aurantimicrobium minutum]MDH6409175.1 phosphoribosyl-AMP cyclohydrolase [Aurantimicrobium minutum]MDH6424724.1 phosphoribosyl-AMP cyclohydrolase [Aurantimicrobium minutum]
MSAFDPSSLKYDSQGLIPVIIQDVANKDVLMLGYMNAEAVRRTLSEGRVTFWSRSRQEYWRKGDTSGHAQFVRSVHHDCDADTLLIGVEQIGAACHTGSRTCFEDYDVAAVVDVDSSVIGQGE